MLSKADIKLINSLEKKKFRKIHNLFIVEGERLVYDAIVLKTNIERLILSESYTKKETSRHLVEQITKHAITTETVTDHQMKSISETISPSGVLALCKMPPKIEFDQTDNSNYLYLDTIQDPGNLGTLLRSANWFGITNVALSENCIDAYNPKVLRGGMGAHFNLNILTDLPLISFKNHKIIGAFQEGENLHTIGHNDIIPWVLVIGSEANGISEENVKLIDKRITIPKIGKGESLNAATAGSIILYHLTASLISD